MSMVNVYRLGSECSQTRCSGALLIGLAADHPPGLVISDNWKAYAVAQTGDEITARASSGARMVTHWGSAYYGETVLLAWFLGD
jgi:hypothetical protein